MYYPFITLNKSFPQGHRVYIKNSDSGVLCQSIGHGVALYTYVQCKFALYTNNRIKCLEVPSYNDEQLIKFVDLLVAKLWRVLLNCYITSYIQSFGGFYFIVILPVIFKAVTCSLHGLIECSSFGLLETITFLSEAAYFVLHVVRFLSLKSVLQYCSLVFL